MNLELTKAIERIQTTPRTLNRLTASVASDPLKTIIYMGDEKPAAPLLVDKYEGSTGAILSQLSNQLGIEVNAKSMLINKINDYQLEIVEELRKLKLVPAGRLGKWEDLIDSTEAHDEFYKLTGPEREKFMEASRVIKRAFTKLATLRAADQEKPYYYVAHEPTEDVVVDGLVPALKYLISAAGTFGGILGDEKEISNFIKTQGRDFLPETIAPALRKKIVAEVALVVRENKAHFPSAAKELAALQAHERI